MRTAIVAIMKNEDPYVVDWIKYHSSLGINDFILFDNNNVGDNRQYEAIAPLFNNYKIQLINLQGREKLEQIGYQIGVYNWAYHFIKTNDYLKGIEYIAFIDIDEYLDFHGRTISEFLTMDGINGADLVQLNWRCYGDNDNVYYDNRPVWVRFPKPCPIDVIYEQHKLDEGILVNHHVKSILKVSNEPVHITVHTTFFKNPNAKCVNSVGEPVDFHSPYQNICYENGYVRHYFTKTAEEYVKRRIIDYERADLKEPLDIERTKQAFFSVNTATKQKMKLFDDAIKTIQMK